jgi:hypothetical protein
MNIYLVYNNVEQKNWRDKMNEATIAKIKERLATLKKLPGIGQKKCS